MKRATLTDAQRQERGRAQQHTQQQDPNQYSKSPHPGDQLHYLLHLVAGAKIVAACGCTDWIKRMNDWGPAQCRDRLTEIVDHLEKQATKHRWNFGGLPGAWLSKLPGFRTPIEWLVKHAIRRAERRHPDNQKRLPGARQP